MKEKRMLLMVIGGILALVAIVKFSIIGYYPREAPVYFGILIVGAVCLYIASKMKTHNDDE